MSMSRSRWVPELWFAAAFLLAMAYVLYATVTSIVREIVLHLDGTVEFRATYSTSVLLPANIRSFKIEHTGTGTLRTATIEHDQGRLRLLAVAPETLNDVVGYVIRRNPSVRVVETKKSD